MSARRDLAAIREEARKWKPGGAAFDIDSATLALLWEDRSSAVTLSYLQSLGLGNRKMRKPLQAALTRRMVDALSIVYSVPAVRWLTIDGERLPEDSLGQTALNEAFARSAYDLLWQGIDAQRNLYRTAVVEWVEDPGAGAVGCYVYGPHQVARVPDPSAPSSITRDRVVALCVRDADVLEDQRWRLWERAGSGWTVAMVDGHGNVVDAQPYGGASPFRDVLPLQVVYDEHPLGQPWLPIPESRVQWALGLNGLLNDLSFLVQMEAHTIKTIRSATSQGLPTEIGPDTVLRVSEEGGFEAHSTSPKITESLAVISQQLSLWGLSEFLSADEFQPQSVPATGLALKVRERALAKRRWRQIQMVPRAELEAFRAYARVHNTFAKQWDATVLPEAAGLSVSVGRAWEPADPTELQNYLFRSLAAGFKSRVDVVMELDGLTRAQAIDHLERVSEDRVRFPLEEYQNAGALTDEAGALGGGSASKTPGQFNPDLTTATDGASVVDAAKRASS